MAPLVYGAALGVTDFVISGDLKATSCSWCIGHVGGGLSEGTIYAKFTKASRVPAFL
jgi:hypothetical protein